MKRKFADIISTIKVSESMENRGFMFQLNSMENIKEIIQFILGKEDTINIIFAIQHYIFIKCYRKMRIKKFKSKEIIQISPIKTEFFKTIDKKDCDYYQYREIVIPKITQLPNCIVIFHSGRYVQYPVVNYVLSNMLSYMKARSKERQVDFNIDIAKQKLLTAFEKIDSNFHCKCNRLACREVLQLYGDNGISPDKKFDNLSYIDDNQIIDFVVKAHNCFFKPNQASKERKTYPKWENQIAGAMCVKTRRRIKILEKQVKLSKIPENQIARFKTDTSINVEHYKTLLYQKRVIQQDLCETCKIPMYFGDELGILKLSYSHQASPDRIDDENIFYDFDNFNLVCISCNFNGKQNTRRYIPNKHKNNPIDFTVELLGACKEWLKVE
jgi:hypothetical protein